MDFPRKSDDRPENNDYSNDRHDNNRNEDRRYNNDRYNDDRNSRYNDRGGDRRGYDNDRYGDRGGDRRGYDNDRYDDRGGDRRGYDNNRYNDRGGDRRGYDNDRYGDRGGDRRGYDNDRGQSRYNNRDRGGYGGNRGGGGGFRGGGRMQNNRRRNVPQRPTSEKDFAILELKYGTIYGGEPNFYAIAEICILFFEATTNKIYIENWQNRGNIDYVSVYSKVDELGHTVEKVKEVVNMSTGRVKPFQEDFELDERAVEYNFRQLRPAKDQIKRFLQTVVQKYTINNIITFDGRRDVFLCESTGFKFDSPRRPRNIIDLQKILNKETKYLFSLNKLSLVSGFEFDHIDSKLRSNNNEYWIHPMAAKHLIPKTAAWDAARLLATHNEFRDHFPDFMIKAQLLLNKITKSKDVEE